MKVQICESVRSCRQFPDILCGNRMRPVLRSAVL
jgi:hypothetical protein